VARATDWQGSMVIRGMIKGCLCNWEAEEGERTLASRSLAQGQRLPGGESEVHRLRDLKNKDIVAGGVASRVVWAQVRLGEAEIGNQT